MSTPIKMGIIGLGGFGARILNPISFFHTKEEIEVVAICDINLERAKSIANEYQIPHWYESYQKMLDSVSLDLVYIATPPSTHGEITSLVIEKGIHVLCEKPLANSINDAKEMKDLAKQANVVHALHFGQNYLPTLNKFHKMITDGYIGDIKQVNLNMQYSSWPPEYQQNDWISTRDGGFLLEQGIHFIQAIQRVFGKIASIQSEVHYPAPNESENKVKATMTLANGLTVLVNGTTEAANENVSLTALGSEGTVVFDFKGVKAGKNGFPIEEVELEEPFAYPWILSHVIKAIKGEKAEIYDFTVGYEAQVVLEILRKGDKVRVDLEPFYDKVTV
ncbi:Gfo/Idh/MocA family oxidoreductase [Bacillus sp. 31A1R]|uniref:Gfo/Idh/MocA family oxidoreductase n=1 Tax=Robertmurraya mangrovi TaxID=3098077 RepID=A0ABU5IXY5_9BACI|nr:Gfo/Idh/MocA family oxidoreductase [Bacillus sp. 31A1R]MDZ5472007.1 Gfo/Idh/MocA family oxidoreductase [Bacillus sp. 31A1R]